LGRRGREEKDRGVAGGRKEKADPESAEEERVRDDRRGAKSGEVREFLMGRLRKGTAERDAALKGRLYKGKIEKGRLGRRPLQRP